MRLAQLLGKLNNLKRMPRTGWLLCDVPLSEVEDVAQHTFEVASIALLLTDELTDSGMRLDPRRALSIAIVHDWAESSLADFPYTALKYLESGDTKKRMEREALKDLMRGISGEDKLLDLWREYEEKRTPEARLVHAADYISMMVQAIKYKERGNRSPELDDLWRAVHEDIEPYTVELPSVRELVGDLDKRYRSL